MGENERFDSKLEAYDWRYSASIVGLIKYFDYLIAMGKYEKEDLYRAEDDVLYYNSNFICENEYLLFAEYYFKEYMHHKYIEEILDNDEISEEQVSLINKKMKEKSVEKVFKDIEFDGLNKEEIKLLICKNRTTLIKEIYINDKKNGKKMYSKFSKSSNILSDNKKICRLPNYTIDLSKKSKSISYNCNFDTYKSCDLKEFDFIPFAFSKSNESFFINNNYSIKQLVNSNKIIEKSENPRKTLFDDLKESSEFIDFDVEVIVKKTEVDYFETLYIRKKAIKIFKKVKNYKAIQMSYKINEKYYIDVEKKVTQSILNNTRLDYLIELLLKSGKRYEYNLKTLIKINFLICGGAKMDDKMKSAYVSAKQIIQAIPENKVNSYKQKLISAITFKDYDRFCEILLQMSSYSGVVFNFAYDLFEDFEENKSVAYTFLNALNKENKQNDGGEKNE